MENPNQNNTANQQQKQNTPNEKGAANGNHRHSHRGHRGGRNRHHGPKKDAAQVAAVAQGTEQESAPAAEKAPAPAKNQNNGGNNNGNNHNKHKHQRRDNRNRGNAQKGAHGQPRQNAEQQESDAISLADWRAKIVIKDASGNAPVEEKTESPAEKESAVQDAPVTSATATTYDDTRAIEAEPMMPAPETPTPIDAEAKKIEVIGVRFRSSGKMYYFDPGTKSPKKGANVIVETARGPEFGEVCLERCLVNEKDAILPLRPLIRIATPEDVVHNNNNRRQEADALDICREKIAEHKLDMKLIDAQYSFDNSKLLFYFSAEGRVDFRELVKNLASIFHTRIELRQIGIRDEARMLGGLGVCGRMLCCSTFLPDFTQVSIKMAKEQNLSLNSSKISGVCGRLMCCLHYESEVYAEEIRKTPSNDTIVKTEDGIGTVIGSTPLAGTIRVVLKDSPDTAPKTYHRDNVTVIGKERRGGNAKSSEKDGAEA